MARARKKPAPPIVLKDSLDGRYRLVSTGIYEEWVGVPREEWPAAAFDFAKLLDDHGVSEGEFDSGEPITTFAGRLAEMWDSAAAVLKRYRDAKPPPPAVSDALTLQHFIQALRTVPLSEDRRLFLAMHVGRIFERLLVRDEEQHALAAKHSSRGAAKARKRKSDKAAKRRPDFQALVTAEINRQIEAGLQPDYETACIAVSNPDVYGQGLASVKRHAKNLWTKEQPGRKPKNIRR